VAATHIPGGIILAAVGLAGAAAIYLGVKAGKKNNVPVLGFVPQLGQGVAEAVAKDALEAAILA